MKLVRPPCCPICARPARAGVDPFCSARCADVDLGRWFTGAYRIPVPPEARAAADEEDGAA
jgi:hypothetical protein